MELFEVPHSECFGGNYPQAAVTVARDGPKAGFGAAGQRTARLSDANVFEV